MTIIARTTEASALELTRTHEEIVKPRKGTVDWSDFDPSLYTSEVLADAARAWLSRAVQEYHSLALFTELSGQFQLLGAPLDWSGAFARMIADEVRHTDLSMRFASMLGAGPLEVDAAALQMGQPSSSLRIHVRHLVIAAFCIGETLSGRMFRRSLRAATVPLARQVVSAIVVDETFHAEFGWEAAALLMREDEHFADERKALADALPRLFLHYAKLCGCQRGIAWAHAETEAQPEPNFGTLTHAGYARAYFDGMEEDVVPSLVAIGLPEADEAWHATKEALP